MELHVHLEDHTVATAPPATAARFAPLFLCVPRDTPLPRLREYVACLWRIAPSRVEFRVEHAASQSQLTHQSDALVDDCVVSGSVDVAATVLPEPKSTRVTPPLHIDVVMTLGEHRLQYTVAPLRCRGCDRDVRGSELETARLLSCTHLFCSGCAASLGHEWRCLYCGVADRHQPSAPHRLGLLDQYASMRDQPPKRSLPSTTPQLLCLRLERLVCDDGDHVDCVADTHHVAMESVEGQRVLLDALQQEGVRVSCMKDTLDKVTTHMATDAAALDAARCEVMEAVQGLLCDARATASLDPCLVWQAAEVLPRPTRCYVSHLERSVLAAAKKGHDGCLRVLRRAGADVTAGGDELLHLAIQTGRVECVAFLLEAGAAASSASAFAAAAHGELRCLELLDRAGVNLGARSVANAQTAAHVAARAGRVACLRYLLLRNDGELVSAEDAEHQTPSMVAAAFSRLPCLEVCNALGVLRGRNSTGRTVAHAAAGGGCRLAVLEALRAMGAALNEQDMHMDTPFHLFVARGGSDADTKRIVDFFAACDVDLNCTNKLGETALHIAAKHDKHDLVQYLCDAGAAVDALHKTGGTALDAAVRAGSIQCVVLLARAEPRLLHVRNGSGETLIHAALQSNHQAPACVRLLAQLGVDIDAKNSWGSAALHLAVLLPSVVEELCRAGADVNLQDAAQATPLLYAARFGKIGVVQVLIEHGACVDIVRDDGCTPVHVACSFGHLNCVEALRRAGADMTIIDVGGSTVAHAAAWSGAAMLNLVHSRCGVDVTQVDLHGTTPAHIVVTRGDREGLRRLHSFGVDVD